MKIEVLDENYVNDIHLIDKSAFQDFWTAENFLCDINTDTRCYLGLFENEKLVAYLSLNTVLDESDVISKDEESVTIALDNGVQVTLDNSQVGVLENEK